MKMAKSLRLTKYGYMYFALHYCRTESTVLISRLYLSDTGNTFLVLCLLELPLHEDLISVCNVSLTYFILFHLIFFYFIIMFFISQELYFHSNLHLFFFAILLHV